MGSSKVFCSVDAVVDSIIGTNVAQPEHTAIVESRRRSGKIRRFPPIAWGSLYLGLGQDCDSRF
jgi:hypothetical protein